MCGISGILMPSGGEEIRSSWLRTLDTELHHRGPDDFGFLGWHQGQFFDAPTRSVVAASGGRLGLVHRRLSILDLTAAGWQPMLSPNRRHAIIFNGEVYNYIELRRELKLLGHIFHSNSDTEVVLAAWCQWGQSAFQKFVGMFALAIIDLEASVLLLARDQFGIKPLYWGKWKGGIAFSSEIPPLLALPGFDRRVCPDALGEFLGYGYTDRSEQTMLSGISRVAAGSSCQFNLTDCRLLSSSQYRNTTIETSDLGFEESALQLREAFLDSVALHLRSDVPVGIALSGGIDSTSVLGAVHHLGRSEKIRAFSFISEDPQQSEENWIDLAASHYGVELYKIKPERADLSKDIIRLTRAQGEPFATAGMFAQARVFQFVQQLGIKVTLDGQGADEMLAGYPTFLAARLADLLKELHPKLAFRLSLACGNKTLAAALLMTGFPEFERVVRHFIAQGGFSPWLSKDWFQERGVDIAFPVLKRERDLLHDRLEQTLYDLSIPALLRYADRNSMAFSVESRVPFLTPRIARLILSMPGQYLIGEDGTSKLVFRRAMCGLVPAEILARKDKVGFSVPETRWLNGAPSWLVSIVERSLELLPMLNAPIVRKELDHVLSGKKASGGWLWRCISLSVWIDQFSLEI